MTRFDLATYIVLLFGGLIAMQLGHRDLGVALLGMGLLSIQIATTRR